MDKTEYRAVIKYLHLKGMSPSETYADMVNTLVDSAPSYATVKRWTSEFKCSMESVERLTDIQFCLFFTISFTLTCLIKKSVKNGRNMLET